MKKSQRKKRKNRSLATEYVYSYLPDRPKDYNVGRGKPPEHTRFRKGESGNPGGRPKGAINLRTAIYKYAEKEIAIATAEGKIMVTAREAAAMKFWEAMLKKMDIRFYKEYYVIEKEEELKAQAEEDFKHNSADKLRRMLMLALVDSDNMTVEQQEAFINMRTEE